MLKIGDAFGPITPDTLSTVVDKILSSQYSTSTKNIYLCSILKNYPEHSELLKKHIGELNAQLRSQTVSRPADYNKVKQSSEANIAEMRAFFKPGYKIRSAKNYFVVLKALISLLYACNPPRRMEYRLCSFSPTSSNYYDLNSKCFVFNDYKTSKKYGTQTVPVTDEIHEMILSLREYHTVFRDDLRCKLADDEDFVFKNTKGSSFDRSAFRVLLLRSLGGSVCYLRRSYISECYKDVPSYEDMETRATAMGHQVNTALKHYMQKSS